MSAYHKFLGREYIPGRQDCFALARDYFQEVYDIWMPNLARPTEFWNDRNLNLASLYVACGFKQVMDVKIEEGDVLLMPLMTASNSHVAVVVEGNRIIHHLHGKLSREDPLWPKWGGRAQLIIRHPDVKKTPERVHLHEVIDVQLFRDPEFQEAFDRVLDSTEGKMRDDYVHGGDP